MAGMYSLPFPFLVASSVPTAFRILIPPKLNSIDVRLDRTSISHCFPTAFPLLSRCFPAAFPLLAFIIFTFECLFCTLLMSSLVLGRYEPDSDYEPSSDPFITSYTIPKRPGFGTKGQDARVAVNAYPVTRFPSGNIYQYDVSAIAYPCVFSMKSLTNMFIVFHRCRWLQERSNQKTLEPPLPPERVRPVGFKRYI